MVIHHALSDELIDIQPAGDVIAAARTTTLYKTEHREVFSLVLLAGKEMPEHKVAGEVTVPFLEGSIEGNIELSIGTKCDQMQSRRRTTRQPSASRLASSRSTTRSNSWLIINGPGTKKGAASVAGGMCNRKHPVDDAAGGAGSSRAAPRANTGARRPELAR